MLTFHEVPYEGKTKRWEVKNSMALIIGWIQWWSPWRKYVYQPIPKLVLDEKCMRQVSDFIQTETHKHKHPE